MNIGNQFEKGVSSENLHLSFCNTQKKVAAFPSKGSIIDYRNTTLLHEYGHYLQQRQWGAAPYLSLSLASLNSAWGWRSTSKHQKTWSEMDANARSLAYFDGRIGNNERINFINAYPDRNYYDSRFYRSYIFSSLLTYLIYDLKSAKNSLLETRGNFRRKE